MKHKAGKGEAMEARERFGQAFIAAYEPSKACSPCEAAFNHPAPRQLHEGAFGFRVFDHLQFDAAPLRRLPDVLSSIPLIHIGLPHALIRNLLHGLRQLLNFGPLLFICRGDMQGQQVTQGVDRSMHFGALAPLGTVVAGARPIPGWAVWCGCRAPRHRVVHRARHIRAAAPANRAPWLRSSPLATSAPSADTPSPTAESRAASCASVRRCAPASAAR